jgi:hypothetical protein
MITYARPSSIPLRAQVGICRQVDGAPLLHMWPIWIRVEPATPDDIDPLRANNRIVTTKPFFDNATLFPITIVTLTVERPAKQIRYTLYPQQDGDQG